MSRQLIWLAFALFIVHHRSAESRRHSRYNVEKLFKMGLKSLGRATDGDDEADDNEDEYDYDEYDNDTSDETPTESTPKESDKSKSGALQNGASDDDKGSTTESLARNDTQHNESTTNEHSEVDKHNTKRDMFGNMFGGYRGKRTGNNETTQGNPRMRDRANLLRIKVAADRIESLLGRFDMDSTAGDTGGATFNDTTTILHTMQQTTISPFPGAYQGYIPVVPNNTGSSHPDSSIRNNSSRLSNSTKRSLKTRHRLHNLDNDGRWRRVSKKASYRRKYKTLPDGANATLSKNVNSGNGAQTKGLQMTVVKTSNCTESSSVNTDILKTVWSLQKMMYKLNKNINKGVRKLGNQGVDNTNEERADIKTNSDRISQLQQGLSGKIDDLRYNITILMIAQKELGRSVSGALEDMMGVLKQMVTMVTGKENKPVNKPNVEIKINATKEPSYIAKLKAEDVNKNAISKNSTQVKVAGTDKGKGQINAPERHRKSQNRRKKKHSFSAGKLRRRNSYSTNNASKFHNDHAIVNKFKNNDYSNNRQEVSGGGQKHNKTHGHASQILDWPHIKQHKPKPVKSNHKYIDRQFNEGGRKSKGQGHPDMVHGTANHIRKLTQTRVARKNKQRSYGRKTRSKSRKDVDEELERLLKQELSAYDEDL